MTNQKTAQKRKARTTSKTSNGARPANTPEALECMAEKAAEEVAQIRGRIQVTASEADLEIGKLEKEKARYEDWKEGAEEDDALSAQERAAELREYDKKIRELKEESAAMKARYQARVDALREDLQKADERERKAKNKLERLQQRGKARTRKNDE